MRERACGGNKKNGVRENIEGTCNVYKLCVLTHHMYFLHFPSEINIIQPNYGKKKHVKIGMGSYYGCITYVKKCDKKWQMFGGGFL